MVIIVEIDAWREFARYLLKAKIIMRKIFFDSSCTSLRKVETLVGIIKELNRSPNADGIICIKRSNILPDFNLLKKNKDDFLKYI